MKNRLHINQFQFKGNEDINNKLLRRIEEKKKGRKEFLGEMQVKDWEKVDYTRPK